MCTAAKQAEPISSAQEIESEYSEISILVRRFEEARVQTKIFKLRHYRRNQGDQMSLQMNRPKCSPTCFFCQN
jgi:hypothetical protein